MAQKVALPSEWNLKVRQAEQIRFTYDVRAKLKTLKVKLRVQSARARKLQTEIAQERNSLMTAVMKEYRKKRSIGKHWDANSLIEVHCYSVMESLEVEEHYYNCVMTHCKDLYKRDLRN